MVEVTGLDRRKTLTAAQTCLAEVMRAEAEQLVLAAHWADLHDPAGLSPVTTEAEARRRRWDGEYGVQPGGEGTPEVLALCFAELGVVLQTSAGGAKHLVGDALDLRHRLPLLWGEVQAGRVRGWKARKVAQATRHLPRLVMAEVDAGLAGLLTSLPWSRFEAVLGATVMRADPMGAGFAEAEAASRRFVSLGRDGGPGLKTLIARGEVLDILTFLAAVNRVADLLGLEGDRDSMEVRRSRAVGLLGQPDRALALLSRHQGDEHTPDAEPEPEPDDEPEPDEPGRRSLDLTHPQVPRKGGVAQVRVQLYVHLTDAALKGEDPEAVCRVEGVGPVTVGSVREWLRKADARVTVRPVTVPGQAVPVDGYEIPHAVREAVLLRNPASVFPWSWCTDRRAIQLDHVKAYLAMVRGGPPGQTRPANLAPLIGTEHQRKTSRRWQQRTPAPGVFVWRSPHGWVELVTNQGTFPLGHGKTGQAIWRAAAPAEADARAVA